MEIVASPVGRNIAEILRQLRALQHYQATGEFMPCGWEPGKPTLSQEGEESPPLREGLGSMETQECLLAGC